jgi:hypothetical protein
MTIPKLGIGNDSVVSAGEKSRRVQQFGLHSPHANFPPVDGFFTLPDFFIPVHAGAAVEDNQMDFGGVAFERVGLARFSSTSLSFERRQTQFMERESVRQLAYYV